MWAGTVLNVHDVTFRDIKFCAFAVATSASLTETNNQFFDVETEFCEL